MKKHTWKRTLALLMMLAMLLNLTPVSVFADDPPDPVDIPVEEHKALQLRYQRTDMRMLSPTVPSKSSAIRK